MAQYKDFVIVKIPINEGVYKKAAAIAAKMGTTFEDMCVHFCEWCVMNPEEAIQWLRSDKSDPMGNNCGGICEELRNERSF